jgi:hypothetical protein
MEQLAPLGFRRLDREVPSEISNHVRPEILEWRRGAMSHKPTNGNRESRDRA